MGQEGGNLDSKDLAAKYKRMITEAEAEKALNPAKPNITNIPLVGPLLGSTLNKLQIIADSLQGPQPPRMPTQPFEVHSEKLKLGDSPTNPSQDK